jgi:hypothetical protein
MYFYWSATERQWGANSSVDQRIDEGAAELGGVGERILAAAEQIVTSGTLGHGQATRRKTNTPVRPGSSVAGSDWGAGPAKRPVGSVRTRPRTTGAAGLEAGT